MKLFQFASLVWVYHWLKKENYDILSSIYDSEAMTTKLSTVSIVLMEKNLIIWEDSGTNKTL